LDAGGLAPGFFFRFGLTAFFESGGGSGPSSTRQEGPLQAESGISAS
jgi:hypothetical protein